MTEPTAAVPRRHTLRSLSTSWQRRTAPGMATGLAWFAAEAIQSIALIPFYAVVLGPIDAANWIAITSGAGLVALACAGYYQPLVRSIAAHCPPCRDTVTAPSNWSALQRHCQRVGMVCLLLLQVVFCGVATHVGVTQHPTQLAAIALYFVGLHLRLAAYNQFLLLNGLRRVGSDKRALLLASIFTTVMLLALGSIWRHVLALGTAALAGNTILLILALRATRPWRRVAARAGLDGASPVRMPGRREMAGLLLLAGAGYLNTGTDLILATRWLAPAAALDYAWWSKLLFAQVAIIGLWTQLRFPFWADPTLALPVLRASLARASAAVAVSGIVLLALYATFSTGHDRLTPWMMAAMALNAFASCVSVLTGQGLTALGRYRFVPPSVAAACLAPAAAWLAGSWLPQAFVLGYLAVNIALAVVNVAYFLSATRPSSTQIA